MHPSIELWVFPHSHFCEKARWALDHKNLAVNVVPIMPGLHLRTVGAIAPNTHVPVLLEAGTVVQGADEIISYLDAKHESRQLTPKNDSRLEAARFERDMDARLGESLRRILYADLLNYPAFIRHCFTNGMPWYKRSAFRWIYPRLAKAIYTTYVISPEQVELAKQTFDLAINELDSYRDGRDYLFDDQFSRADLSVAAMLSLLVQPPQHPFAWRPLPDPRAQAFCDGYRNHPSYQWVGEIYRRHRQA